MPDDEDRQVFSESTDPLLDYFDIGPLPDAPCKDDEHDFCIPGELVTMEDGAPGRTWECSNCNATTIWRVP